MSHYQEELRDLVPSKKYFAGIDSDGCVFDSMEVKQKQFFIPAALKHFKLEEIEDILRETWEFVNLYSAYRGGNRFRSLIKVFDLLKARLQSNSVKLPETGELKRWVAIENKLSNDNLASYYRMNPTEELRIILEWSEDINCEIKRSYRSGPPFPCAEKAIKELHSLADIVVVSQTPLEALLKEWNEYGIDIYVNTIAGQEHGTKKEHLELAAGGKYDACRIIMIGDAKGDLQAASENGICFYPVIPGREDLSWQRFSEESLGRFLDNNYKGEYENRLIAEFLTYLPEKASWDI